AAETKHLGFKTDNVLMAQVDLSLARYDSARTRAFQRDVLARARALPGVENAALAARVPFGYSNNAQNVIGDRATRENPDGQLIFQNVVSPDYFRTAGPAIVRGREFSDEHEASSQHV